MSSPLLLAEGKVTPSCSKSHLIYVVHLNRTCRKLHVEFSYEPKKLEDRGKAKTLIQEGIQRYMAAEDREAYTKKWESFHPLSNLLTLSFDDENGFRGAAHRHDPVQHLIIDAEAASPGLIAGPIPRGQLRITISLHCVVTEECRYRLHVWEEGSVNDEMAAV
jgi:hypothetical protein